MEVSLAQMLEAREQRAFRQFQLNQQWKKTLISFSMNIPGPVKFSPVIYGGFLAGCRELEKCLPADTILHQEHSIVDTGCEAVYVVDMEAEAAKAVTTAIEDTHPLGRLYDMDVLDIRLHKLDREVVGGKSRDCIVCGAPGRACASRRLHSVPQLQEAVRSIFFSYFAEADQKRIGAMAVGSLLQEVYTTPKPGLVDHRNTGSHRDMDMASFQKSAESLRPYFTRCIQLGMETRSLAPEGTFLMLRKEGIQAEKTMLAVTGGVNTHKGAIFTMGILCGAVGRLWSLDRNWSTEAILNEVSSMTRGEMEKDFDKMGTTAGAEAFRKYGICGIRGEVAQGLPSVAKIGLPVYRRSRAEGFSENDAGVIALLSFIANVKDTCMIHRGGLAGAEEAAQKAAQLLKETPYPDMEAVELLDDWFMERNLSPGGCADLLSAVYFLSALENYGDEA